METRLHSRSWEHEEELSAKQEPEWWCGPLGGHGGGARGVKIYSEGRDIRVCSWVGVGGRERENNQELLGTPGWLRRLSVYLLFRW